MDELKFYFGRDETLGFPCFPIGNVLLCRRTEFGRFNFLNNLLRQIVLCSDGYKCGVNVYCDSIYDYDKAHDLNMSSNVIKSIHSRDDVTLINYIDMVFTSVTSSIADKIVQAKSAGTIKIYVIGDLSDLYNRVSPEIYDRYIKQINYLLTYGKEVGCYFIFGCFNQARVVNHTMHMIQVPNFDYIVDCPTGFSNYVTVHTKGDCAEDNESGHSMSLYWPDYSNIYLANMFAEHKAVEGVNFTQIQQDIILGINLF